jgi:exosortase
MQVATAALALGALWFMLCRHLSSEWSLNEQYSYGWFVPFFAAFLFWLRWEDRPRRDGENVQPRKQDGAGGPTPNVQRPTKGRGIAIGIAVLALLILFPVRLFEIANPDWRPLGWIHAFAVIGITLVAVYLAGGWSWVKHFSFPILFFLVAVPWISAIEGPIVQGLMRAIAALAAETVSLLGIPAEVQGNLIRIATGVVGINEACSGVRSLQTSIMIGLLFGELKRLPTASRVLLAGGAVAIALVANFFRAVFLVWIASTREIAAVDRWHDFAGYAIVAVVFLGSLGLAALLGKRGMRNAKYGTEEDSSLRSPHSPFRIPNFPILLCLLWLFAIEIGVETWYRVHERNLTPRTPWTVRVPTEATGLREIKIEESVRQTLRFDEGRELAWKTGDVTGAGSPTTNYLFSFRWNPGSSSVVRARAHRPDICLPGAGWKQLADYGTRIYQSRDGIELPALHVSFKQDGGTAIVHTFFCLQEDKVHQEEARPDLQLAQGMQPDWSLTARVRIVRHGIRNLGQQVLEVLFLNQHPLDQQTAEERFATFVREMVVKR